MKAIVRDIKTKKELEENLIFACQNGAIHTTTISTNSPDSFLGNQHSIIVHDNFSFEIGPEGLKSDGFIMGLKITQEIYLEMLKEGLSEPNFLARYVS